MLPPLNRIYHATKQMPVSRSEHMGRFSTFVYLITSGRQSGDGDIVSPKVDHMLIWVQLAFVADLHRISVRLIGTGKVHNTHTYQTYTHTHSFVPGHLPDRVFSLINGQLLNSKNIKPTFILFFLYHSTSIWVKKS